MCCTGLSHTQCESARRHQETRRVFFVAVDADDRVRLLQSFVLVCHKQEQKCCEASHLMYGSISLAGLEIPLSHEFMGFSAQCAHSLISPLVVQQLEASHHWADERMPIRRLESVLCLQLMYTCGPVCEQRIEDQS